MDLNARVDVNCGRKDGRMDGLTDGKPDAYIAPALAGATKRIYSTKGYHSVKTACRVVDLFLCTLSDGAVYLYKIS